MTHGRQPNQTHTGKLGFFAAIMAMMSRGARAEAIQSMAKDQLIREAFRRTTSSITEVEVYCYAAAAAKVAQKVKELRLGLVAVLVLGLSGAMLAQSITANFCRDTPPSSSSKGAIPAWLQVKI